MCNLYEKSGQMLRHMMEAPVPEGSDFIDCCMKNGIGAADASELIERQLGMDGEELLSILLK